MEIKWSNLAFFVLVVFTFVVTIRMRESIVIFLSSLGQLGPEHSTDEKIWGLMAFGLVAVTLVAILRVFIDTRNRD